MMEHEEQISLVPAYVRGDLEPADRSRLEAHLAGCQECSARVESARLLAEAMRASGEALFAPHPPEMALRDHALGRRGADSDAIAGHLASCAACALEVSVWRRGAATPAATGRRWIPWLSAAAGLAIGFGLAPLLRQPPTAAPSPPTLPSPASEGRAPLAGPMPLLLLHGPLRGDERLPALSFPGDASYLLVGISPGLPASAPADRLFRVELRPADAGPAWSIELTSGRILREMSDTGILLLPVPATVLPPGVYDLRLLEASDPVGPPIMEWHFEIVP